MERTEERLQFRLTRATHTGSTYHVFCNEDGGLVTWDTLSGCVKSLQVGTWYTVRYTYSHMDGEHKCVKRLIVTGEAD